MLKIIALILFAIPAFATPVTTEYALVVGGNVTKVIVADSTAISQRQDGPWVLTPYDGSTGSTKAGIGYAYAGGIFIAPLQAALSVNTGDAFALSGRGVSSASLSYKWKKNGVTIPGATTAQYTVGSAASSDAGTYTYSVTDGTTTVTSGALVLTVN